MLHSGIVCLLLVAFRELKVLHFPSECHLSVSIFFLCAPVHVCACICLCVRSTTDSQMEGLSCLLGCPIHHVEREQRGDMSTVAFFSYSKVRLEITVQIAFLNNRYTLDTQKARTTKLVSKPNCANLTSFTVTVEVVCNTATH